MNTPLPPFPERTPGLVTLRRAFPHLPDATLRTMRAVMRGTLLPEAASDRCRRWTDSCYNPPAWAERALCALDDLMETHGVETVYAAGTSAGTYPPDVRFEYLNTGDPYTATILRVRGVWRVGTVGDTIETMERNGRRCA